MKKICCLLVDDEPLAIKLLQNHIAQLGDIEVIGACPNAVKALNFLKQHTVDLLFLDIQMPCLSGIDLLKTVRSPPKVIFMTAFPDYALDGYDLDVIDYLLKPITFDRFFRGVERYRRAVEHVEPIIPSITTDRFIFIKSGYKQVKIELSEILFIESIKDYIKVRTYQKDIVARYKISEIEAEFGSRGFLRVHRSFVVNLSRVTAFSPQVVEMGELSVPIGESYKEYVLKIMKG